MGNALFPCCVKNNLEDDDTDEETQKPWSEDVHLEHDGIDEGTRRSCSEDVHLEDDGNDEETRRPWPEDVHLEDDGIDEETRRPCSEDVHLEDDGIDEETRRPFSEDLHLEDDGIDEVTWRPWSDLPDLVLYNILMHLVGIEAYISFIGVCRYWRSVARASATDLMESMPMIIRRSTAFDSKFGFYSFCENRTYRNIIVPENIGGQMMMLWLPVYSRGNLITRKRLDIPIVVNPWTSATWEFPSTHIFWSKATLSAKPTSPDCVLVLSSLRSIQWCRIGGSKWSSWTQPNHTTWSGSSVLALRNKVFWSDYKGRVLEMDMLDHSYTTASKSSPLLLDAPNFEPFWCNWPVLVDISGELLLINSSSKYLLPCTAFQLDFSSQIKRWVKVESLGFHAVVVSHYMGEVYDTRIVKGLLNNCVYYHEVLDDSLSFFKNDTTLLKVELGANLD